MRSKITRLSLIVTMIVTLSSVRGLRLLAEDAPDWRERIRVALDRRLSVQFDQTPLEEVVKQLQSMSSVDVLMDARYLDRNGLAADTPVTFEAQDLKLRSILDLMLDEYHLRWIINSRAIMITTIEGAEDNLLVSVYPASKLARPVASGNLDADYDMLIDLFTSVVHPDSWADVGGPGAIHGLHEGLAVAQTREVHESLQRHLDAYHRLQQMYTQHPERAPVASLPVTHPEAAEWRERLNTEVSYHFVDVELHAAVSELQESTGLPLRLHVRALEEVGLGSDEAISGQADDLPLRVALDRLLSQFQLTWVLCDEVILLTTPEGAEEEGRLETRVYPIYDLIASPEGAVPWLPPPAGSSIPAMTVTQQLSERLALVIQDTVEADSWNVVGGPGVISTIPNPTALFVVQRHDVHDAIEQLLDEFRHVRGHVPPQPVVALEPTRVIVYRVPDSVTVGSGQASEFLDLLETLIGRELTNTTGAVAYLFHDSLVVRHTDAMHCRIQETLEQLDTLYFWIAPSVLGTRPPSTPTQGHDWKPLGGRVDAPLLLDR